MYICLIFYAPFMSDALVIIPTYNEKENIEAFYNRNRF